MASLVLQAFCALTFVYVSSASDCHDDGKNCAKFLDKCQNKVFIPILTQFCKKSCNYCTAKCVDREESCVRWSMSGYCQSPYYSTMEKEMNCARTCGFCGEHEKRKDKNHHDWSGSGSGDGSGDHHHHDHDENGSGRHDDDDGSGSGSGYRQDHNHKHGAESGYRNESNAEYGSGSGSGYYPEHDYRFGNGSGSENRNKTDYEIHRRNETDYNHRNDSDSNHGEDHKYHHRRNDTYYHRGNNHGGSNNTDYNFGSQIIKKDNARRANHSNHGFNRNHGINHKYRKTNESKSGRGSGIGDYNSFF